MPVSYESFLTAAVDGLVQQGAHVLMPSAGRAAQSWLLEWDQVLAADGVGGPTVYAFSAMPSVPGDLGSKVDSLAAGLAGTSLAEHGFNLVTVSVLDGSVRPDRVSEARKAAPSTYYSGLHPYSWVVDLSTGSVRTGRRPGQPEGRELLERAARGEALPDFGVSTADQLNAFRQLMQGRQPLVTYALVIINVGVFGLLYLHGGPQSDRALVDLGAIQPALIAGGQWWRLVTGIFLHASIPHILFNMMSLFAVGTLAERLYGSWKFLAIYMGSGLVGSLASLSYAVVTRNMDIVGVGASGAIFGVAGALITIRFHGSEIIPRRLRERVSTSMIPLVLLSLVFAFLTPHVDNTAHIGGLLGGMALSFLFPLTRQLPLAAGTGS